MRSPPSLHERHVVAERYHDAGPGACRHRARRPMRLRGRPLVPRRQVQLIRTLAGTRPQERIDFSLDANHLVRLREFLFEQGVTLLKSCHLDCIGIRLPTTLRRERRPGSSLLSPIRKARNKSIPGDRSPPVRLLKRPGRRQRMRAFSAGREAPTPEPPDRGSGMVPYVKSFTPSVINPVGVASADVNTEGVAREGVVPHRMRV